MRCEGIERLLLEPTQLAPPHASIHAQISNPASVPTSSANGATSLNITLPLQWISIATVSDNVGSRGRELMYGATLFDIMRLGRSLGASRNQVSFGLELELERLQAHAGGAETFAKRPYLGITLGARQVHEEQLREFSKTRHNRNTPGLLHGRERRASRTKLQMDSSLTRKAVTPLGMLLLTYALCMHLSKLRVLEWNTRTLPLLDSLRMDVEALHHRLQHDSNDDHVLNQSWSLCNERELVDRTRKALDALIVHVQANDRADRVSWQRTLAHLIEVIAFSREHDEIDMSSTQSFHHLNQVPLEWRLTARAEDDESESGSSRAFSSQPSTSSNASFHSTASANSMSSIGSYHSSKSHGSNDMEACSVERFMQPLYELPNHRLQHWWLMQPMQFNL